MCDYLTSYLSLANVKTLLGTSFSQSPQLSGFEQYCYAGECQPLVAGGLPLLKPLC